MHLALCSEFFQYLLTTWKVQPIFIVYSILWDKLGEGTGVAGTKVFLMCRPGRWDRDVSKMMHAWQPESHTGKRMSSYHWWASHIEDVGCLQRTWKGLRICSIPKWLHCTQQLGKKKKRTEEMIDSNVRQQRKQHLWKEQPQEVF